MAFRIATGVHEQEYLDYCRAQGIDIVDVDLQKNDELGNIEKLRGFDGVIAMSEPYTPRVLEALKDDLKLILRHGVGYDAVDTVYAAKLGICCCNTPGAMSTGVAETAISMMLELSRKFYERNAKMSEGLWHKGTKTHQFEGSTIGLVGFGNIAQCLARYLSGFTGCKILAYDIRYNEEALEKYNVQKASLDQIARESDFVSVHVPLIPATAKIINAEFLAKMKPSAYLINTSRGGTVDEQALIQALKDGVIAGAALDVFEKEPVDPKNELLYMDNVFKTPHIATNTHECALFGFDGCIKCIKEYEAGQVPEYTLNPSYIENLKK